MPMKRTLPSIPEGNAKKAHRKSDLIEAGKNQNYALNRVKLATGSPSFHGEGPKTT